MGAATTQRVLAKQLSYQPNQLAANPRKEQNQTIEVIVPHLRDNFFARVVHSMEATATTLGYQVLICQSGDEPSERQALARRAPGPGAAAPGLGNRRAAIGGRHRASAAARRRGESLAGAAGIF